MDGDPANTDSRPNAAERVRVNDVIDGKWRIDAELGAGGMGVVFAATDLRLGRTVAIKLLKSELVSSTELVQRFMREARASARLTSEHACRIYEVGELATGTPYIVMELLEGMDLARTIRRGPLTVELAADYVAQACEALAEAHAIGIVHRDFKPANLFLTKSRGGAPLVKVLDFGIATAFPDDSDKTLTATHAVIGSPQYMSPEQLATPRAVDPRSDVWSIGVTLYQLVSGTFPFAGETVPALSIAIATQPHRPLEHVSPAFASIVDRCLAKEAPARFANAAHVASKLASLFAPIASTEAGHAPPLADTLPTGPGAPPAPPLAGPPASSRRAGDPPKRDSGTQPGSPRTSGVRRWIVGGGAIAVGALLVIGALAVTRSRDGGAPRFTKVDLSHFANHPLDWLTQPPVGEVFLQGVPFELLGGNAGVVRTHANGRDDLPYRFAIPVNSVIARQVHALISGVWLKDARHDAVGHLGIHHVSGASEAVALTRGSTLRDGWLVDRELNDMTYTPPPSGVTWLNVYFDQQTRRVQVDQQMRDEPAHGFLDMLSAEVDPSPIDRIDIVSEDPSAGIALVAVTLETSPH